MTKISKSGQHKITPKTLCSVQFYWTVQSTCNIQTPASQQNQVVTNRPADRGWRHHARSSAAGAARTAA